MKFKATAKQIQTFRRLKRKYNVSLDFLMKNMEDVLRFMRYATTPHMIIKRVAIRCRKNHIVLNYWHLRRFVIDPKYKKIIKLRRENVKKWSKQMVMYLRLANGPIIEFSEDVYKKQSDSNSSSMLPQEEISKQMKEQLELLKERKRTIPLINRNETKSKDTSRSLTASSENSEKMREKELPADFLKKDDELDSVNDNREKSVIENVDIYSNGDASVTKEKQSSSFLDMLMSKVKNNGDLDIKLHRLQPQSVLKTADEKSTVRNNEPTASSQTTLPAEIEISTDSSDEFLGFEEAERIPEMNSAFVSETLNAYMRENDLEGLGKYNTDAELQTPIPDGFVAPGCIPPKVEMPIIPENLQKLRTVAERRQFLQKTKNHKYAIIYTGSTVYRELQKKMRQQKVNRNAIQLLYSSHMPFTRKTWSAASFLLTETNRYYFQEIIVDDCEEPIKLYGVYGNNEILMKRSHKTRVSSTIVSQECSINCIDLNNFRQLKPIATFNKKVKLNNISMKAFYKPCPLSCKPKALQNPIEPDDLAILKSDELSVVRVPHIELEVFPQLEKQLPDIAKRYLEFILPYGEISREWAEFSVSTLVDSVNKKDFVRKDSFTFPIPYNNDRNHMLVRKVINRSEKLDQSFQCDRTFDLTFREEIDEDDPISMECGEILTDMINSVAISCSENTFIKEDPSGIESVGGSRLLEAAVLPGGKKVSAVATQQNKKQNRLLSELRRLNATIIDAGTRKDKSSEVCKNEFCTLGCICTSLKELPPIRQHCGKPTCMFNCSCKILTPQGYLCLEKDGGSLTTEDAFLLRRQATARLAKIEKEFTSTIVLTENETLFINESEIDKKRRCTKLPKRYDDFIDSDESMNKSPSGKKSGNSEAIDEDCRPMSSVTDHSDSSELIREPIFVKDHILDSLKHCTVTLVRLEDVNNLAVWCMIHQLYNCFCGAKALEGKVITIETEGDNSTFEHEKKDEQECKIKSKYSFEKAENMRPLRKIGINHSVEKTSSDAEVDKSGTLESETESVDNLQVDPDVSFKRIFKNKRSNKIERRGRTKDKFLFYSYLTALPNQCRRIIPIPHKMFRRRNRKRAISVREEIKKNENIKTRRLLNEHIMRSVYFHNEDVERIAQKAKMEKEMAMANNSEKRLETEDQKQPEQIKETTITEKQENDEQFSKSAVVLEKNELKNDTTTESNLPVNDKIDCDNQNKTRKRKLQMTATDEDVEDVSFIKKKTKFDNVVEKNDIVELDLTGPSTSNAQNIDNTFESNDNIDFPKIASYCSLSNTDDCLKSTNLEMIEKNGLRKTKNNTTNCTANTPPATNENDLSVFNEIYDTVIKNMNNLVSKKMQDIDMALKRESKFVPRPNEEILCIIKWSNFLDAFIEGYVYIWEVKMQRSENNFLAATITNLMPMVVNAVGVVVITAVEPKKLPLLGRMLVDHCRLPNCNKLAIVMQGRRFYWVVKGFLRQDCTRACAKPTPYTHPLLTKKINILCSLLVKQQLKEDQKNVDSIVSVLQKDDSSLASPPPPSQSQLQPPVAPAPSQQQHSSVINSTKPSPTNSLKNAMAFQDLIGRGYASIQSNIEFRKISKKDITEIHCPERLKHDHRWLVLDLYKDFSHIFVPDFHDLISLDRVHRVMAFSKQRNKIVKLQFFQNAPFDAYVTPTSQRKLYFGPLQFTTRPPLLLLLQSVDGSMMLREVYQKEHNIKPTDRRTMAFWVLQINGRLNFAMESGETKVLSHNNHFSQINNQENDDNDDCMIVDDTPESGEQENRSEAQKSESNRAFFSVLSNPESSGVPVLPSVLPQSLSLDVPHIEKETIQNNLSESIIDSTENSLLPRMNFTISSSKENSNLIITPDPSNSVNSARSSSSSSLSSSPSSTQQQIYDPKINQNSSQSGQFVPLINFPVIASVAAPDDAPYGSTIFVSNVHSAPNSEFQNNLKSSTLGRLPPQINTPTSTVTKTVIKTAGGLSNVTLFSGSTTPARIKNFTRMSPPPIPFVSSVNKAAPINRRRTSVMCTTSEYRQMNSFDAANQSNRFSKNNKNSIMPAPSFMSPPAMVRHSLPAQPVSSSSSSSSNVNVVTTSQKAINPTKNVLPTKIQKILTTLKDKPTSLPSPPSKSLPAAMSSANLNKVSKILKSKEHIQSIGCTTITKVIDNLDRLCYRNQDETQGSTDIRSFVECPVVARTTNLSKVAKITACLSNTSASISAPKQQLTESSAEPLVLNVNFIDNHEPSASIVIKPLSQMTPTSLANNGVATTKTSGILKLTPSMITTTAKTTNSDPNNKQNNSSLMGHNRSKVVTKSQMRKTTANINIATGKKTSYNLKPHGDVNGSVSVTNVTNKPISSIGTVITSTSTLTTPNILRQYKKVTSTKTSPVKQQIITKNSTQSQLGYPRGIDSATNIINIPSSPMVKLRKPPNISDPLEILNTKTTSPQQKPKIAVVSSAKAAKQLLVNTTSFAGCFTLKSVQSGSSNTKLSTSNKLTNNTNNTTPNAINQNQSAKLTLAPTTSIQNSEVISLSKSPNAKVATSVASSSSSACQYGYFTGNLVGLPKFVAKQVKGDFLLKIPTVSSILRLKGLPMVNTYLNQHVKKYHNDVVPQERYPIDWKFIPQDRRNIVKSAKIIRSKLDETNFSVPSFNSVVSTKQLHHIVTMRKVINKDPILIED